MLSASTDDNWTQIVVKMGKIEESFLVEEGLLRGYQVKPQGKKG
jgi:hypothetical protein